MQMLGTEQAIHFPEQAEVPESKRHLRLRTLVWQFLAHAFADRAAIGCDQFVYWAPNDPRRCLAPDAFVCFGTPDDDFRTWKVWERGAPQVAVEIISDSDEPNWDVKLARYRELGVSELVWFDPEHTEQPLRIWDRQGDELVERTLHEPRATSAHLAGYWLAFDMPGEGLTLRLSHDERGQHLFPTPEEAERIEREAETRRADEAERKLRELEALLQSRS